GALREDRALDRRRDVHARARPELRPRDEDVRAAQGDRGLVLELLPRIVGDLEVGPGAGGRVAAEQLDAADRAVVEVEEERRVVDDAAPVDGEPGITAAVVRVVREDVDRAGVVPGLAVARGVVAVLALAVVRVVVVGAGDVAAERVRRDPRLVDRPAGAVAGTLHVRRDGPRA